MTNYWEWNATAIEDSVDGMVKLKTPSQEVMLPTIPYVAKGDQVKIAVCDNRSYVIGVFGQGDIVNRRIHQNKADDEYIAILSDIDLWEDSEDVASNDEEFKPSKIARVCKRNYEAELWSYSRIENVHNSNKITDEEYMWIIGKNTKK